ncbi:MAG: hypothetical protein EPN89_14120 [Methylovulum sp.]|nr:MAG: hypothetical protein EPN89_14120 [Methylovulum sp.]
MGALSKIQTAGFTINLIGDSFEVTPASALTDGQRVFLKSHKAEIIAELRAEQATNDADTFDDRHHCHECRNLINGRCITQRFRPVDDIPRRCADYVGRVRS